MQFNLKEKQNWFKLGGWSYYDGNNEIHIHMHNEFHLHAFYSIVACRLEKTFEKVDQQLWSL